MGYETKLIIGRPIRLSKSLSNSISDNEIDVMVAAEIDLCKLGSNSAIMDLPWQKPKDSKVSWYWYGSDGNTKITEDFYGKQSQPIDLVDLLAALIKDTAKTDYRRLKWARAFVESLIETDSNELKAFLFGH